MASAINTSACRQVGVVNAWLNGSIQAANFSCPIPARLPTSIPRIDAGEKLDAIRSAANPRCDHKRFNAQTASKNGQSRAKKRILAR